MDDVKSIYEHLGYPNAKEMERKAQIVAGMQQIVLLKGIDSLGLAKMLDLSEKDVEKILNGRFNQVSEEALHKYHAIIKDY